MFLPDRYRSANKIVSGNGGVDGSLSGLMIAIITNN
jgi:hypothetical protein